MAQAGWENGLCFEAQIFHRRTPDSFLERPRYYFYLMARNDLFFWGRCGRSPWQRRRNRLRLVCRSLIRASRLRARGQPDKSAACLLGLHHGLIGAGGAPRLEAAPPRWMVWASRYVPRIVLKVWA